jgi:hypothetical protein
MFLKQPSTAATVTALDQFGQPFEGDLSAVSVTSDQPGVVGATPLSPFVKGVATLTLVQGTPGTANLTVSDGKVITVEPVKSYEPVLTTLEINAAS